MPVHDWLSLDHLDRMTDSTGLIQHAIYSIPRRESGYTTDDNARALRLCTRLWGTIPTSACWIGHDVPEFLGARPLSGARLSQLHELPARLAGCRRHRRLPGSGRPRAGGSARQQPARWPPLLARELIEAVLPALAELRSLRAQAYVILAWGHLRQARVKNIELLEAVARYAADRLVECYRRSQRPDWQWFESRLTYANAVLPHALFVAGQLAGQRIVGSGRRIVRFLRSRDDGGRHLLADRKLRLVSPGESKRCTMSNPWKLLPWPTQPYRV